MINKNFKNFIKIFVPVMLFLLVMSITHYMERIFLADFSEDAFTGSLNGFFLARIFQSATTAVVVGGQAYVSLLHGADQPKQIGPCVWQFIWFSLATALIVPPIGFCLEYFLYRNTTFAEAEAAYFSLLCWFNFFTPLGGALSAFYLGRGKPVPVVVLTILMCLLNIGMDYIFIFGWGPIPAMGSRGAALGKVVPQGLLCLILGACFLSSKNRERFDTAKWRFEPRLFYHYAKPGFLRGLSTFPCLGDWTLISRTMSVLSEAHSLVFSIGSTLYYFFTFGGDALFQTTMTVTATHIGKKEPAEIWRSVLSGLTVLGIFGLLMCIPFFLFPESLMICFREATFFTEVPRVLQSISFWLWLSLIGYGLNMISLSLVTAARDATFLFWFYCFLWVISFAPVYLTMAILGSSPDKFWLLVFFTNMIISYIFFKRAAKQNWLQKDWRPALLLPENISR